MAFAFKRTIRSVSRTAYELLLGMETSTGELSENALDAEVEYDLHGFSASVRHIVPGLLRRGAVAGPGCGGQVGSDRMVQIVPEIQSEDNGEGDSFGWTRHKSPEDQGLEECGH